MTDRVKAIVTRAAWTFLLTFATVVSVLTPTDLWSVGWERNALGSAIIAAVVTIKNAMITPPEVKS